MRLRNDIFERLLGVLARGIIARPWWTVTGYVIAAVVSALIACFWLEFETDQNELVSNDLEYNRRYERYLDEFGDQEHVVIVIDEPSQSVAIQVADALAAALTPLRQDGTLDSFHHRVDTDAFARGGLVLVPAPLLKQAAGFVHEHDKVIRACLEINGLEAALRLALDHLDASAAQENPMLARFGFTALQGFLEAVRDALNGRAALPDSVDWEAVLDEAASGGETMLVGAPFEGPITPEMLSQFTSQGYFVDGDLLFVLVMPCKDYTTLEVIKEPLGKIRTVVDTVRERFRNELGREVRMGITGRPVLQADEMQTTNDDMTRAVILALAGVLVLFMVFFRAVRRPFLTAVALVISISLTFGLTTVTVGHLNLLSIVFAVMLVSLGTEFGVHVIARYQEELAAGGTIDESLRNALLTAGKGNITGATTTAAAFYTTLLADFRGLSELGFIAGSGVLICMITMNSFLPALLIICDRWRLPRAKLAPLRVASLFLAVRAPVATLVVCGGLLAMGLPLVREVRFNSNLLDLQAQDLPSVEFEKLIIEKSNHATWYACYLVETLDEVRRIVDELERPENSEVISKVESVLDYVPDNQAQKVELIGSLGRAIGAPRVGEEPQWSAVPSPVVTEKLLGVLESLLERLDGFLDGTILGSGEGLAELQTLTELLDEIIESIESSPAQAGARLGEWQVAWIDWVRGHAGDLFALLDPVPMNLPDLAPFIKDRVVSSKTGSYLVYGYPKKDIWQNENIEEFVGLTRAISKEVTGVPEQVYESTRIMKRGFTLAAIYSMIAVFFLVLLDFRSVLFSGLAMIPVVLGLLMTVQLMPLFDVSFNLANFFAIPIIIGGGINGGVHMIHRFREERSSSVVARSTGTAIVLSQLSNILGFGMMLLAHHRGVASLGGLIVFGFSSCLFVSLVVLPAALKIVERRRYRES